MRKAGRSVFLLLMLVLAGCAPEGPPFGSAAGSLPPVSAGEARFYFYRWLEPYESLSVSTVYLSGRPVGVSEPGAVLYRDVPPGQYLVQVYSPGIYPNQFKTVAVGPGQTVYVRIESLSSWARCSDRHGSCSVDTFVVNIVDPTLARSEMRDLRLIRG